ncbi:MAG: DUF1822 family protein [Cyanobacteria bacterium CRU_2_1]|nr:DUF1822 family protein [Cyanobacteria bacterium CRU_2_1]
MIDTDALIPIAIPITATDRRQAYQFAAQQPTQAQTNQVYRNTLAVLVMQRYLQLLGIDTDLDASQSWNPLDRLLENIADLYIPALQGCLECRPVRQGDRKCTVPEEVWDDRVGYVVVQIDEPYQEGQLLGFVESVSVPELPLSYLQPLTKLIEQFLERSPQPSIQLRQWLKRIFEPDWQFSEDLLNPIRGSIRGSILQLRETQRERGGANFEPIQRQIKPSYHSRSPDREQPIPVNLIQHRIEELCYRSSDRGQPVPVNLNPLDALVHLIQTTQDDEIRWQSAELLWELDPHHPNCPVISAKDLGFYLAGHTVALMVGMLPKSDNKMLILLRVYPLGQLSRLPLGLKLIGLDETRNSFFEVESRQRDKTIQFKFTADEGDRFDARVVLNDASFTESFVV